MRAEALANSFRNSVCKGGLLSVHPHNRVVHFRILPKRFWNVCRTFCLVLIPFGAGFFCGVLPIIPRATFVICSQQAIFISSRMHINVAFVILSRRLGSLKRLAILAIARLPYFLFGFFACNSFALLFICLLRLLNLSHNDCGIPAMSTSPLASNDAFIPLSFRRSTSFWR